MKSIFRNSLFGLVALLAFVGMFTPETLYAIGTCSSLPPSGIFPEIDIAVTGYGTFSNSSPTNPNTSYNISVVSGTQLDIHVDTLAEPSTRNSMSYPGGSEIIYSGPNGRMGDGRDYTSSVITSSSQIIVSVGPNNCTPITDGESGSVTVNITVAPTYTLTVAKAGTGTGTITSSPAGINYGTDNSEAYASGTSVTLSQTATGGSTFAGWSGACSGTGACVVSMTQARSVTATFNAAGYTLTASKAGTGTGTITSSPAGINCGADCSESYNSGTSVSLTATPAVGSTFTGWSGSPDCSNDAGGAMANPTGVMMNAAKSCAATFDTVSPPSCSASPSTVAVGQSVTITASGGSGGISPFYTWSTGSGGGSCVSGGTCTTSYSSSGTKTVTVTRNGVNATCPVNVSTDTPPTGALTSTASCTATGWADDADTTVPRSVRIYSDGSLVSTVTAGTTGCSGTACTFSSNLTGLVSTGVSHAITGTVQGNDNVWYALSNPMSMTCPIAPTPPTAAFTGSSACTVSGWGDDVNTTVARPIRIYSDGSLVSTVTAGTTGCTGSACTFSANLTGLISTGVAHNITGTVQGDTNEWIGFTNPQTSLSLTCPVTTVSCIGPSAGQTGQSYTFTGQGASAYTWSVSPVTGFTPTGSSGTGGSVTKTFSTTGAKAITFAASPTVFASCIIDIAATPPALAFNLQANGVEGPITVAYNAPITLSWTSAGASSVQKNSSTPLDSLWSVGALAVSGSQAVSPATVRRVYTGRATNAAAQTLDDSVTVRVTPECLPAGQTVIVNQPASLTARGGDGVYTWNTGGGTACVPGAACSTTYSTTGTKTVTVTSDSLTSTACSVTVNPVAPPSTGTVVVVSNISTTWDLTSTATSTRSENTQQTLETYTNMPVGTYTLTNVPPIDNYSLDPISPASSQVLSAGGTVTFTINYDEDPPQGGTEDVDLKINGVDNPAPVVSGSRVELSWTSLDIIPDSCVASGGVAPWSGYRADEGTEDSGVLTETETFVIRCDAESGGEIDDSVAIYVTSPQCSDGSDNDNDTFTDWDGVNGVDEGTGGDDDPDCTDAADNNEKGDDDDTGGNVTECSDGFDNDGDGGIDYEARSGGGDVNCSSLLDDDERGSPDIREI